jgi:CubicO group peptidase (beta-lactamase class C family)
MTKVVFSMIKHARIVTGIVLTLFVLPSNANVQAVPTPTTDPVMARNMKAIATMPSITSLDWRKPTATVGGNAALLAEVKQKHFPSTASIKAVQDYSDAHDGKGLLIWYDGQLVAQHFAENISDKTLFAGFSMHKSLIALAVLAAIEDGIIGDLDDSIGSYLSPWKDDLRGKITLRQLLQQSSGLAHYAFGSADPKGNALVLSSAIIRLRCSIRWWTFPAHFLTTIM